MQTTRGEVAIAANHSERVPAFSYGDWDPAQTAQYSFHLRTVASMTDDQCLVIERRGHHA